MRVDKINSFNIQARKEKTDNNILRNTYIKDTVSFNGNNKEEKVSFINKIANFFKKEENLTPEEKKSEEIKVFLGSLEYEKSGFKKLEKTHRKIAKTMLEIGKLSQYKPYTDYDRERGEKLIFGEIDENTGSPKSVSLLSLDGGFKELRSYEFYDGLNLYDITDNTIKGYTVRMQSVGGKIIHYSETEIDTGYSKEMYPKSDGFNYIEGYRKRNGEIEENEILVRFSYDEDKENVVQEKRKDGGFDTYTYNKEKDMWTKN